jgi:hypothetical protein
MIHRIALTVLPLLMVASHVLGDDAGAPATKTEHFDVDPKWDGVNNHITPQKPTTVVQDFGYRAEKADIGGRIQRAAKPAYYAAKIEPKTLNDKLAAAGTFTLEKSTSASAVFFGWFNANQPGTSGRPPNSLGLELSGENSGARLAIHMLNSANQTTGKFITRFEKYRTREEQPIMRPTPIKADGTRYTWTLDYDPAGANGAGEIRFLIKSDAKTPQDFEDKPVVVALPAGFKQTGATFDRFGLMNGTKPGGPMWVSFDDVSFDGQKFDFAKDPGWLSSASRETYEETEHVGAHDFGYSPTHFAGGASAGEVGGSLWRSGKFADYADKVGPLTANDKLEASGRVILKVGAPDSDILFGWFSSSAKDDSPDKTGDFIGVHVGGPTRVGHYFTPQGAQRGPVLVPGKAQPFSIAYDPNANNGNGAVTVKLGEETFTHTYKQRQNTTLDRFGLCTITTGGQVVKIYFDDLTYTATAAKP